MANVYAHYAIDTWFENEESKRCSKKATIVRYADDMVICCRSKEDADKILEDLKIRLVRFSLELSMEKTKIVSFNYKQAKAGVKQETFDFLGFTFFIGKSRNGQDIRKLKTSSKRFKSKLKKVEDWCQAMRHRGNLKSLWKIFRAKLRGHIQYYAVSFNGHEVSSFCYESTRVFFKWMNRRSQKRSFDWKEFTRFMERYPLPEVTIKHKLF
ncbi:MAG: hypothetical protein HQK52_20645 [Oligoflexia bacterium]|nr:hypothetical protein [Oligoflexia bacterium]